MDNKYASIISRVKALVIDSIILILLMYSATEIFGLFDNIPNYLRIGVFVFLFLLYEPILVSVFGATIGHFFNDIEVKRESNENKNLNLPFAIARFITKLFLGWISLLTVNSTKKKQAIHDYVGQSVVKPYKNKK
ncbi:RDD family protein [Algibacter sp. R77976]|uniref:RDD family protein n=1 Tax=Algibacter sp. R77976 TaxID=3093873 RepID=UPI0037C692CF